MIALPPELAGAINVMVALVDPVAVAVLIVGTPGVSTTTLGVALIGLGRTRVGPPVPNIPFLQINGIIYDSL
jgi:hypothetical protein